MTQPKRVNQEPLSLGDAVAKQVRALRLRHNWSVRQLAEECARLGAPQLTAASLGNIERGQDVNATRKRRDVTVDELAALARALAVPPLLLLFPIGVADQVSLPTGPMATWDAVKWFTGEAYPAEDVETHWAVPVYLFRTHERIREQRLELMADQLFAPEDKNEQHKRAAEIDALWQKLLGLRGEMRRHGLTPPPAVDDLEGIDERARTYLTPEQAEARIAAGETLTLQGKAMKPGDPTRLGEAIGRGRQFAADFSHPAPLHDEDEDES